MEIVSHPDLLSRANQLDQADPLARFRQEFYLQPNQIYLDGNSLGLASRPAESALLNVLEQWKSLAIEGWTKPPSPWLDVTTRIAKLIAPLVGASADQIAVGNSTTVNLHQLLCTLYQPTGSRKKILVDELSFPSNLYAIRSHLNLRQLDPATHLHIVPAHNQFTVSEEEILNAFTDDIAIAVLPSVLFNSGQLLDMEKLSQHAHARGILIGFDCSHSIGAVPHQFEKWNADFAYWCTYKYLNGGPGSSGALFLNSRHFNKPPGMAGWFGCRKDRQFNFSPDFEPAPDARALEIATPNILSMAPLLGSLQLTHQAGIESIRTKSLAMTSYLLDLFDFFLAPLDFQLITPRLPAQRGGHISVLHPQGARICLALRTVGVVTDFRPPAMIRITPAPLYTSFAEVYRAIQLLHQIVTTRSYQNQTTDSSVI